MQSPGLYLIEIRRLQISYISVPTNLHCTLLHGLPVVEWVVAALGVPEDRLARLELVDGDDLPQVLVQGVDDLHLVRGELKVVDLQVVQELGFDDALQNQANFVGLETSQCPPAIS